MTNTTMTHIASIIVAIFCAAITIGMSIGSSISPHAAIFA